MRTKEQSTIEVIASSGIFQIDFFHKTGNSDFDSLIEISRALEKDYGSKAVLSEKTIEKYFNRSGSLPFVARYRGKIIGYIIGIPLEYLNTEPWVRTEENFGMENTIYTYAFIILSDYRKNGYASMLKKVYLSKIEKLKNIEYVSGHVIKGAARRFKGNIEILNTVQNWQGTGKVFEYYRRIL